MTALQKNNHNHVSLRGRGPILPELARDEGVRRFVSEKIQEVLEDERRVSHLIERVFGLEASLLEEKEKQRFILFAKHVLARQIFSFISSGNFSKKVQQKIEKLVGEDLIFHDIAHSVVAIEDEQHSNSVVLYFLGRTAEELVNNKRVLSDEVRALLWFNLLGTKPSFISLCNRDLGEKFFEQGFLYHEESVRFDREWTNARNMFRSIPLDHFEAVLEVYTRAMYANLRRLNDDYIDIVAHNDLERDTLSSQYDQIIQNAIKYPHPLLIQNARYIFEHKDDAKVLYALFENICGSYMDRMEKRAEN